MEDYFWKHLGQVWSDERWIQRRMIQERLKQGTLKRSDIPRIVEEHKQIAKEYEEVHL